MDGSAFTLNAQLSTLNVQRQSGRAQTNPTGFNNGQSAGQPGQDGGLLNEALNQPQNKFGTGIARQFEHDEAAICFRRVVAHVSKTEITGEQTVLLVSRVPGNHGVFGIAEANVPHVNRLVSVFLQ